MTDKFTPSQKANVVLWYALNGDCNVTQNKFRSIYSKNDLYLEVPSENEIIQWFKNFQHTGYTDDYDAKLHEEMSEDDMVRSGQESKIGHLFSNVLKKLNYLILDGPNIRTFHPYHMELIKFDQADMLERTNFAKSQLDHIKKWSHILQTMWFTGEAKFFTDGRVESNNLIYTVNRKADELENLPHKTVQQYRPSNKPFLTVWCAMNSEIVIGPYIFLHPFSADCYKIILKDFVRELHPVTPIHERPIFVQDDSKLHSGADASTFLEKAFPHHWIGSGSSYAIWPHHSADLSPLNFFLWGYIKSRVYKTVIDDGNMDELKKRIKSTFKNIGTDLLEEAVEEYKTRLERVVKTNGHLVDATVFGQEVDYDALRIWGTYAYPYVSVAPFHY